MEPASRPAQSPEGQSLDPPAAALLHADVMSPAQRHAAARAIADESARRDHLVVYLSGSHAYGFPSPDSDLDLKAVHIAPTRALLGLSVPKPSADRMEVIDGIEIDYTSNELQMLLAGVLAGNGNFIERILGKLAVVTSPEHEALAPLVRANLSQRVFRHYAGFANSQLAIVKRAQAPTAKKVLYVLRTALTGAHLLRTGELVVDVRELLAPYGFADAAPLIEVKLSGERTPLDAADAERWRRELGRAMAALEQARDASCLPAEPPAVDAVQDWLMEVRRARW